MSETEILDPLGDNKEPAACFGTWDKDYKECTEKCEVKVQCKANTLAAGRPPSQPTPELSKDDGLSTADPVDMLMSALKGRYEVETTEEKTQAGAAVVVHKCRRKDGRTAVIIRVNNDGGYLVRSSKAVLHLKELETARQAVELFSAIMVV